MNTPATLSINGSDLLTHSRMQTYRTCARKHQYQYELGVRPSSSADFFRLGAAVHTGIDVWNKTGEADKAIHDATSPYHAAVMQASSAELANAIELERETVVALLNGYFAAWAWDRHEDAEHPLTPAYTRGDHRVGTVIRPSDHQPRDWRNLPHVPRRWQDRRHRAASCGSATAASPSWSTRPPATASTPAPITGSGYASTTRSASTCSRPKSLATTFRPFSTTSSASPVSPQSRSRYSTRTGSRSSRTRTACES